MSRKKRHEVGASFFGSIMPDLLFLTLGLGFIFSMILMINQGVKRQATVKQKVKLESLLSELESKAKKDADKLREHLAELNAERDRDASEREERADAANKFVKHTENIVQEIGEFQDRVRQTENALDKARTQARQLEGKLAKLRDARRVRLIFVVDTTASMADGINEIRSTLKAMSETMPAALTSFEVGVIAYRDGKLDVFSLREFGRDGAELKNLGEFLDGLEPVNGLTCIDLALKEAIKTLERSQNSGSDIIVLTADVGPGDIRPGYDATAGNALVGVVRRWANVDPESRRFLAFLTAPVIPDPIYKPHRPFFERLGSVTDKSRFSTRLASMFPIVFDASFPKE